MTWTLRYSPGALKALDSLDSVVAKRVLRALERLAETNTGDLQQLKGSKDTWRLRVGDWRVFLSLDQNTKQIQVLNVKHRREAYR